jgi:PAS domain S-box-containing protein
MEISPSKQAEQSLIESERRYRDLFEHMNEGFAYCRMIFENGQAKDFVYLAVNPMFGVLTGLKEVTGKRATEVIPGIRESDFELFEIYGRVATTGKPEKFERFVVALQMWFGISVYSTERDFFVTVFEVITDRKESEAQLRKLSRTVEQSPVAVMITDVTGTIEYVNQAFTKVTGYTSEEAVGENPRILKSGNMSRENYAKLWATVTAGRTWSGELHNRRKNGELFWEWATISPLLDQDGKVTHYIGIKEDITERKQKTDELRWQTALMEAQLDAVPDAILVVDSHGRKILQNRQLLKLFIVPEDIANDENDSRFLRHVASQTKDPTQFAERVAYLYAHPDEVGRDEVELADGTILDRYSTVIHDKEGIHLGRIWTFRDITKGRQVEAQLRQAQKMEAIGTLAGGIAHDFNNILAAMFGYGSLLQESLAGNSASQEDLAQILKAANRAKDLVQQILTFSHQREQKREVIRLDTVIKEAMKFLRASLPAEIKIEVNLADDAPAVLADATQIYQVTMNLATNALHAMEGRPGRLTVSLDAFEPDAQYIQAHPEFRPINYTRLAITDTGQGISAKTLEHIFEPFFTTKPVGKGTGLGLSVVHGIVQSYEGAITVNSQPGQGTTFCLYFPAQTCAATLTDVATSDFSPGHGEKILLTDDEPALTAMYQRLLEHLNYQVTISNSARETVGLCRENSAQFDLAITDLTMPEMNGIEVARQIHAIRPNLPVILASGTTANLNRQQLLEVGICELLEKPASMHALADVVQSALAKQ